MKGRSDISLFYRAVLFLLSTLFLQGLKAQELDRKGARNAYANGAYEEALPFYRGKHSSKASKKIRFRYAVCAIHDPGSRSEGLAVLQDLADQGMEKARFWIGVGHRSAGRSDQALEALHRYRKSKDESISGTELDRQIQMCVRAQVFQEDPVHVDQRRVRFKSSFEPERVYMTRNGGTLFFQGEGTEDARGPVYVARRKEGGLKLSDTLSLEKERMQLAGIASNGSAVVLSAPQADGDWKRDLYVAEQKESGWSGPERLGSTVNTEAHESRAWMQGNGRLMIFSSARKGGNGGLDLYIVKKLPTGDWAKARNLSPAINTPYDEDAPCLLPDERTLYFLSEGHRSMGDRDIFRSFFEEEKKRWIVPQNPGYPVNSSGREKSVSLTGDESKALITRSIQQDPYRISKELELLYQDSYIQVVNGTVRDAESGEPLKAKLLVIDPMERSIQGVYRSRSDDGSFVLAIRPGKQFELIVEADGYAPKTRKVSVQEEGVEVRLKEEE